VNTSAIVFGWCCIAVLAAVLGLSLTAARRTRLGRPFARWCLVATMYGGSAQLVNLYTHAYWAPYLFWLVGPVVLGALVAEFRYRGSREDGSS
jgi:hypothetical protein